MDSNTDAVYEKIRRNVTGLLLFTGQVNNNTSCVDKDRSALTGHSICCAEVINDEVISVILEHQVKLN